MYDWCLVSDLSVLRILPDVKQWCLVSDLSVLRILPHV